MLIITTILITKIVALVWTKNRSQNKRKLETYKREQISARNPFHDQIKGYLESHENRYHFQTCPQGLNISPLQANLKLDAFKQITNEANDYVDDIILSHK